VFTAHARIDLLAATFEAHTGAAARSSRTIVSGYTHTDSIDFGGRTFRGRHQALRNAAGHAMPLDTSRIAVTWRPCTVARASPCGRRFTLARGSAGHRSEAGAGELHRLRTRVRFRFSIPGLSAFPHRGRTAPSHGGRRRAPDDLDSCAQTDNCAGGRVVCRDRFSVSSPLLARRPACGHRPQQRVNALTESAAAARPPTFGDHAPPTGGGSEAAHGARRALHAGAPGY
jgi:hypothetical protein